MSAMNIYQILQTIEQVIVNSGLPLAENIESLDEVKSGGAIFVTKNFEEIEGVEEDVAGYETSNVPFTIVFTYKDEIDDNKVVTKSKEKLLSEDFDKLKQAIWQEFARNELAQSVSLRSSTINFETTKTEISQALQVWDFQRMIKIWQ